MVSASLLTSHYSSLFLLKTFVRVNGQSGHIEWTEATPFLHCSDVSIDLQCLVRAAEVILRYGVHRINTFYCDEALLLSVSFASQECLQDFIKHKDRAESSISSGFETIIRTKEESTHQQMDTKPPVTVSVTTQLYLMTTDPTGPNVCSVDLVNYSQIFQQWIDSKTVDFQTVSSLEEFVTHKPADLKDLIADLREVIEWRTFGMHLNVPLVDMEHIQSDNRSDLRACREQMLITWAKVATPTWQAVVHSLIKTGYKRLAKDIAQKRGVRLNSAVTQGAAMQPATQPLTEVTSFVEAGLALKERALMMKEREEMELLIEQESRLQAAREVGSIQDDLPKLQARLEELKEIVLMTDKELELKNEECETLHDLAKVYKKQSKSSKDKVKRLETIIGNNEKEVQRLERVLVDSQIEVTATQKQKKELLITFQQKSIEMVEMTAQVQRLNAEKAELSTGFYAECKRLKTERQLANRRLQSKDAYITLGKKKLGIAQDKVRDLEALVLEKDGKINDFLAQLEEKSKEMNLLQTEMEASANIAYNKEEQLTSLINENAKVKIMISEARFEKHQTTVKAAQARTDALCLQKLFDDKETDKSTEQCDQGTTQSVVPPPQTPTPKQNISKKKNPFQHFSRKGAVRRRNGTTDHEPPNSWIIKSTDLCIGKQIGKGAFGDVFEAHFLVSKHQVAVKTFQSLNTADKDKVLKEAEMMKQYDHPNIIRLIGICSEQMTVCIVMELLLGGDFLNFLRKNSQQLSSKNVCEMCIDCCAGMEYLQTRHCIHRDLAARNCLVTEDGTVKISDFGLSCEGERRQYSTSSANRQPIPVKWAPPEAFRGEYTLSSDIWSYGVVLWEAFTRGFTPYPGMTNVEVMCQTEMGYRMQCPAKCPREVYELMLQCWQHIPSERPNFTIILQKLRQISQMLEVQAEEISKHTVQVSDSSFTCTQNPAYVALPTQYADRYDIR